MYMMVATIPAILCRINPSLQFDYNCLVFFTSYLQVNCVGKIFRTSSIFNIILTNGQVYCCAIGTIYLWLKEKVGRQPFGLAWINMLLFIFYNERCRSWPLL